jgi:ATP-dependent RNA helicase UAP56/SUB2
MWDHLLMSFLAISFVSSEADQEVLQKIQERFTVAIPTLPDVVDPATYMTS